MLFKLKRDIFQILLSAYKSLESNKPTQSQESKAEFLEFFSRFAASYRSSTSKIRNLDLSKIS